MTPGGEALPPTLAAGFAPGALRRAVEETLRLVNGRNAAVESLLGCRLVAWVFCKAEMPVPLCKVLRCIIQSGCVGLSGCRGPPAMGPAEFARLEFTHVCRVGPPVPMPVQTDCQACS